MTTLFSKRHYIAVAKVLKNESAPASLEAAFADLFERDNDNFDRARFLHACETGEALGAAIRGGPAMQYGYSGAKWDRKLGR